MTLRLRVDMLYDIGGAPVSTVTVSLAGRRWSADLLLSAKLSIANNNGNLALAA